MDDAIHISPDDVEIVNASPIAASLLEFSMIASKETVSEVMWSSLAIGQP